MSQSEIDIARGRLPLPRLLEQHGLSGVNPPCPWCAAPASVVSGDGVDSAWVVQLKAGVRLEEVVGESVQLKRSGKQWKGRCVLCGADDCRVLVSEREQLFWCTGCRASGDVIGWQMKRTGGVFAEAVRAIALKAGMEPRASGDARKYLHCGSCWESKRSGFRLKSGWVPPGLDEVAWLEVKRGVSRGEAFALYLQEAGVGGGERLAPSVMPGKAGRAFQRLEVPESEQGWVDPGMDHAVERELAAEEAGPSSEECSSADSNVDPVKGGKENPRRPRNPAQGGAGSAGESPEFGSRPRSDPGVGKKMSRDLNDLSGTGGAGVGGGAVGSAAAAVVQVGGVMDEEDGDPFSVGGGSGVGGGGLEVTSDAAVKALQEFYSKLDLTREDLEKAWLARGLTPHTLRVNGVRSSRRENLGVIQGLMSRYPAAALIRAGLCVRGTDWLESDSEAGVVSVNGVRPNERMYGKGLVGKVKLEGGREVARYDWTFPLLIPYWRPEVAVNGGGSSGRGGVRPPVAVVTEGELKGMALWQTYADWRSFLKAPVSPPVDRLMRLRAHKDFAQGQSGACWMAPQGCRSLLVAAFPGIAWVKQSSTAWDVRFQLDGWLRGNRVRTVVVCFDNEDKSHKAPEARHNALVNALYLASDLTVQGFDGRFCQIDARWRDAAGKADFDGVLAQMIHGAGDRRALKGAAASEEFHEEAWRASAAAAAAGGEVGEGVDGGVGPGGWVGPEDGVDGAWQ